MKLIEFCTYPTNDGTGHWPGVQGWAIDIFKFKRKSLIEIEYDETTYKSWPSLMFQIGPTDLCYLSLGLIKFNFTISIWARHYGD